MPPFEVIPVIDVRHGVAVRALAGERANYQPLVTPLAANSDPSEVGLGLCALYPFTTLYVADLDGIEGRGANTQVLAALARAVPELDIWADNGSADAAGVARLVAGPRVKAVAGSETQIGASELAGFYAQFGDRIVLSLDFSGETFKGDPALFADASLWPRRVIVMTLARVGMSAGPDLARISDVARRAGPKRQVYAAGGVRDLGDLFAVRAAGAAGALVASALHSGQIKTGDLIEIAG